MSRQSFCEQNIWLKNQPISFADRPYLRAPYASTARRLVIRASRQVEKSTLLINMILYEAVKNPGIHILFVCPREEQAHVFSHSRLTPTVRNSPLIRRHLLGNSKKKLPVMNLDFVNGSRVFLRAAYHSGDSARGIDADVLFIDEFQDIADGILPVLEETMSHSPHRRLILTGTPKTIDNHLESVFRQSTAHEFKVPCGACQCEVLLDDRCLGLVGLECPDCRAPIDRRHGRWIARNPDSAWGNGFWINHPMVPWVNYNELLEKQRTYDPALFKNECLGLPTTLGELQVTRAELEACCRPVAMANTLNDVLPALRPRLVAGIDWGGGAKSTTVLVIGYMDDDFRFVIVHFARFGAREEPDYILTQITQRCTQFGIRTLAADGGGNGYTYNRLLFEKLGQQGSYCGILYSASEHEPVRDGFLIKWTVNRSASIGAIFGRVKKQSILFPRVEECGSFLDEIGCEIAAYDDQNRSIKYTHPDSQPDDALHATNYALVLAVRNHNSPYNAWNQ